MCVRVAAVCDAGMLTCTYVDSSELVKVAYYCCLAPGWSVLPHAVGAAAEALTSVCRLSGKNLTENRERQKGRDGRNGGKN